MTSAPTLLCVHAHPDDEAIFTAGVTSHYAALGYRVVLITCTNGQLGFDDHGRPGPDPLHDVDVTRADARRRTATRGGTHRILSGRHFGLRRLRHGRLAAERPARCLHERRRRRRRTNDRVDHGRRARDGRAYLRRERLLRPPRSHNGQRRDACGDRRWPPARSVSTTRSLPGASWRRSSRAPGPRASSCRRGSWTPRTRSRTTWSPRRWTCAPSPKPSTRPSRRTLHRWTTRTSSR